MASESDKALAGSVLSYSTSRSSVAQSDCLSDVTTYRGSDAGKPKGKDAKKGFLSQLKGWVSTSEPSAQALKKHRKDAFQRAGVSPKDRSANARLNAPLGDIPEDAIKAKGKGPDPEEVARHTAQRRRQMRQSYSQLHGASRGSASYSSSISMSSAGDSAVDNARFSLDKPDGAV